jgi:hypothetical protein
VPIFEIEFKPDAKMSDVAKLEKALQEIADGKVQQGHDNFTAPLKWKTDRKDLANLMGRLNQAANDIVTDVKAA